MNELTLYTQLTPEGCGPQSLNMVLDYYEKKIYPERAKVFKITKKGVSIDMLRLAAKKRGMFSAVLKADIQTLFSVRLPAIAHMLKGHYVVIESINFTSVKIFDTEEGIYTIPLKRFLKHWFYTGDGAGVLVVLYPEVKHKPLKDE